MNRYLRTLTLISAMMLSSCLKFSADESGGKSTASNSSAPLQAVVHNFNPSRTIDLQDILDKYPSASNIYIGVKGVTGVTLSADEARSVGQVTIGARGTAPYYDVVVSTPDGNMKTRIY